MTDQHGLFGRKYDFLEQLSMEDLEYLLRLGSDSVETEEFLDAVTEVIIAKEQEHPTGRLTSVDDAWHEFQTLYNTAEKKNAILRAEAVPTTDCQNTPPPDNRASSRTSYSWRRLGRSVAIVTMTAALIFSLMIGVQAVGFDVFGTLARWTESTFHHVPVPRSHEINIGLENTPNGSIDVQRILGTYAPTWLPEGAMPTSSNLREDEFGASTQVSFILADDRRFFIQLDQYIDCDDIGDRVFESDAIIQEEYLSHSKIWHIISNEDYLMATWSDSFTMQSVFGELSIEDIKSIVDSIGG